MAVAKACRVPRDKILVLPTPEHISCQDRYIYINQCVIKYVSAGSVRAVRNSDTTSRRVRIPMLLSHGLNNRARGFRDVPPDSEQITRPSRGPPDHSLRNDGGISRAGPPAFIEAETSRLCESPRVLLATAVPSVGGLFRVGSRLMRFLVHSGNVKNSDTTPMSTITVR